MQIQDSNILNAMQNTQSNPTKKNTMDLLRSIYDHLVQMRDSNQKHNHKDNVNNEWLLVANLIDRFLFLTYCFIVTSASFAILREK